MKSRIPLYDVFANRRRKRIVLSIYCPHNVAPGEFYDAVCERLRSQGVPVWEYPDDATIYFEHWILRPHKDYQRIVRVASDHSGAIRVIAIDLKKWSRGRKPKEPKR